MWTLVTGGAKHLGANLCLALAEKGHSIVVHYRHSRDEASEVVAKCQMMGREAAAIQGDFTTIKGVQDFVHRYLKEFPETVTLINNVGNYLVGSALKTSVEEWTHLF